MSDYKKPRPVRVAGAVVNTIQGIAGGLTAVAGLEGNPTVAMVCGVTVLVTSVVSQSLIPVLEGRLVPAADVVQYKSGDGLIVEGPVLDDYRVPGDPAGPEYGDQPRID